MPQPSITENRPPHTQADTSAVAHAAAELRRGSIVVIVDSNTGEAELVAAAGTITRDAIAFMVKHGSGFIRAAMTETDCNRLRLPVMWHPETAAEQSGFAVSVDAAHEVSTGISARDRARTIRLLADPATTPDALTRPGHVVPIRVPSAPAAKPPGTPAAAIRLCRLADITECAAMAGMVSPVDPVRMARGPEADAFAERHGLAVVSSADVWGCPPAQA